MCSQPINWFLQLLRSRLQPTDWLIVYYSCGPYVKPADCSIVAAVGPMCSRLIDWLLQLWSQVHCRAASWLNVISAVPCAASWLIDYYSCGPNGQRADWLIGTAAVPVQPADWLIDWLLQLWSLVQPSDRLIVCFSCGPTCSRWPCRCTAAAWFRRRWSPSLWISRSSLSRWQN